VGEQVGVGIVGCGNISRQYLATLRRLPSLRLCAVSDLDLGLAQAVADTYDGVRAVSVEELIGAAEVEVVLNLTVPAAHASVALAAIAAGKQVYGEKPLAVTTAEATEVLRAASAAGVRVGCAPDTVLGTGVQTARRAIDDGHLGTPLAATATMVTPGHERWHPNPDFYYTFGGGPVMDMGPYYLSALVTLLGPVASVIGAGSRTRGERVIGSGPRAGERVPVSVDTHVTGVLVHESGALSTLVMSFDAVDTHASPIEVHGDAASLVVPDPNQFHGPVLLKALGDTDWRTLPVSAGYQDAGRGYGLADMMAAGADGRFRASGELAYHVLDVTESLFRSAEAGQAVTVASTCERPDPVPLEALPGGSV
jgi:predicted dehydrogenase